MGTVRRFEDLICWQKARELNKIVAEMVEAGKFGKNFRLINHVESSCGSIMDNIAEGFERGGNKEFLQFLYIEKGSCGEFRSQLYRLSDRGHLNKQEFEDLYGRAVFVASLLQNFIAYLKNSPRKGSKYVQPATLNH